MFDVGFFELVMIGVVALVVLGPEKLPGAIRTASLWIGRLRRSFNNIKQDIEREIGADDIRRQLRNEAILDKFKTTKSQVTDTMNMVKKETEAFRKNVELEAQAAAFTSTKAGAPPSSVTASATPDAPSLAATPTETAPIQNSLEFPSATESATSASGTTTEK
ncbi:MAG: Sec-independent protein translocase protein TatB [Pseudomonadota bacterium]